MTGLGLPRIGLSTTVLDPQVGDARPDGIGVYTRDLLRGLRDERVPVCRVASPAWRRGRLRWPAEADLALPLPAAIAVTASALTGLSHAGARRLSRRVDVYHATDYVIPRLPHTPVVATLYDAIPFLHPEWTNPRFRGTKNRLLRSSAANADCVVAISQAMVPDLVEHFGVPAARIRVVRLGVTDDWFAPPPPGCFDRLAAHRQLQPGYFLFVGSLQPRKNVAAILAAYDALSESLRRDHQLVIAGKYGWSVPELRAELERRRGDRRCLWLDYVSAEELRGLYEGAAALVFPSLAEGFGYPVLEALATGTPVITSDLPSLRELAGSCATYVEPRSIEAIAVAMRDAADRGDDPDARARRRAHAHDFRWADTVRATIALYRELA